MRPLQAVLLQLVVVAPSSADVYRWTYEDVFGGPDFWGLVNRDWHLCKAGRLQSPIDVDPAALLFDPNLLRRPFALQHARLSGALENTGQLPVLSFVERPGAPAANMTGGPLGAYSFRVSRLALHFGDTVKLEGSEHTLNGIRFPAEIQVLAYNDIYKNFTDAMMKPNGLATVAVLVDIGEKTNGELKKIVSAAKNTVFQGSTALVEDLALDELLPRTSQFLTYAGSLTTPGCYETVTWLILNKRVYISRNDVRPRGRPSGAAGGVQYKRLNDLQQSAGKQPTPNYMARNFRPLQQVNARTIRTNIDFPSRVRRAARRAAHALAVQANACPTMLKSAVYKVNSIGHQSRLGHSKRSAARNLFYSNIDH